MHAVDNYKDIFIYADTISKDLKSTFNKWLFDESYAYKSVSRTLPLDEKKVV